MLDDCNLKQRLCDLDELQLEIHKTKYGLQAGAESSSQYVQPAVKMLCDPGHAHRGAHKDPEQW